MITVIQHLDLIERQLNAMFKPNTEVYLLRVNGKRHSLHVKNKEMLLKFLAMKGYDPNFCSAHSVPLKNFRMP